MSNEEKIIKNKLGLLKLAETGLVGGQQEKGMGNGENGGARPGALNRH